MRCKSKTHEYKNQGECKSRTESDKYIDQDTSKSKTVSVKVKLNLIRI